MATEGFCYLQQCYGEGRLLSAPNSSSHGWFCWCELILESIAPLIPEEFTLRMQTQEELLCLGVLCCRQGAADEDWSSRQGKVCRSLAPPSLAQAAGSTNQRMAELWLRAGSGQQQCQCLGSAGVVAAGGTGPCPQQQQVPLTWAHTALQPRFNQQLGQTALHWRINS